MQTTWYIGNKMTECPRCKSINVVFTNGEDTATLCNDCQMRIHYMQMVPHGEVWCDYRFTVGKYTVLSNPKRTYVALINDAARFFDKCIVLPKLPLDVTEEQIELYITFS
jgi:phage FluMu protein Com